MDLVHFSDPFLSAYNLYFNILYTDKLVFSIDVLDNVPRHNLAVPQVAKSRSAWPKAMSLYTDLASHDT